MKATEEKKSKKDEKVFNTVDLLVKRDNTGLQFNHAMVTAEYTTAASIYGHIQGFISPMQKELLKERLTSLEDALRREALVFFGRTIARGEFSVMFKYPVAPEAQKRMNAAYRIGLNGGETADMSISCQIAKARVKAPETFGESNSPIHSVGKLARELFEVVAKGELTDEEIANELVPELNAIVECMLCTKETLSILQSRIGNFPPLTKEAVFHLMGPTGSESVH